MSAIYTVYIGHSTPGTSRYYDRGTVPRERSPGFYESWFENQSTLALPAATWKEIFQGRQYLLSGNEDYLLEPQFDVLKRLQHLDDAQDDATWMPTVTADKVWFTQSLLILLL